MLVISDLHWRTDTPSWRKEPCYATTVLRPQLAKVFDMDPNVCVAGDVFHRSADFEAVFDLMTFLLERKARLYAVRGQHDMKYHNESLAETGFNLLAHIGLIVPLDDKPVEIDGLSICGYGWGREIPECGGDVLIAHVSVSHGNAVIPGADTATAFREKAKNFRMVFTGDNHVRFSISDALEYQGRYTYSQCGIFNAGCFHQMSADLIQQCPIAWHVNGEIIQMFHIPYSEPMVNEAYMVHKAKGKAEVAGAEFVTALAEARKRGGGNAFLAALKKARPDVEDPAVKELLGEIIKICEEAHT